MTYGSCLKLFWHLNSAAFIVGQSSQRYYCAITIGDDAVISAFRLAFTLKRVLGIFFRIIQIIISALQIFFLNDTKDFQMTEAGL